MGTILGFCPCSDRGALGLMAVTSALASMLATSPAYVVPPTNAPLPPAPLLGRRTQNAQIVGLSLIGYRPKHQDFHHWHHVSSVGRRARTQHRQSNHLRATLSVCMEEDCVQQGAPLVLAKLRKEAAKRQEVEVSTCPCVGMCGLGPCVTVDWDESGLQTRGGIDPNDDVTLLQLVEDAARPGPRLLRSEGDTKKSTYDDDPYTDQ